MTELNEEESGGNAGGRREGKNEKEREGKNENHSLPFQILARGL
jgi:hypothetical protein